jgi:DNA repair protein RadC
MGQSEIQSAFKVTEVDLIYRNKVKPKNRTFITNSQDAYSVLKRVWDKNKIDLVEQFKIVLLDHRNACLGVSDVASGGMTNCIVDSKIVFATALKSKATKIILAHNHPTGNLTPSTSDLNITKKLVTGGQYLDIEVLEHIIMTSQGYYSMADNGLIP